MMRPGFDPAAVVAYWRAAGPSRWYAGGPRFDAQVRLRLGPARAAAVAAPPSPDNPSAALATLILFDQVPRNIFRGQAEAFATDPLARAVARAAIARRFDRRVPHLHLLQQFFYLPLMHAEDLADQERCVALCRAAGDEMLLRYAEIHRDVIRRFGRFPHRNAALGRTPTAAETRFLADGGFSA